MRCAHIKNGDTVERGGYCGKKESWYSYSYTAVDQYYPGDTLYPLCSHELLSRIAELGGKDKVTLTCAL